MRSETTRFGRSESTKVRSARRFLLAALAATAALAVPSAPTAEATPLACADPCTITSSLYAYIAPVTEVASGGSVVWTSIDGSHPTQEQQLLGGSGPLCLDVAVSSVSASPAVTFDIADGGLSATTNGNTLPCTAALAIGDLGFVLPYQCQLHPNMQAALVVTPAA